MDMNQSPYMGLSGMTTEELAYIQQATADLNENQQKYFYMSYATKRKSPQDVLLFTILGFFCVAGIQRFLLGQIGMGLLYLFTGGLCLVGTIVDLVNHKDMALDYNRKMAYESHQMAKMGAQ